MTVHQCPKCELRFALKPELEDHCWHDHPEFRHEYPARTPVPEPADPPRPNPAPHATTHAGVVDDLLGWLIPSHPVHPPAPNQPPNEQPPGQAPSEQHS